MNESSINQSSGWMVCRITKSCLLACYVGELTFQRNEAKISLLMTRACSVIKMLLVFWSPHVLIEQKLNPEPYTTHFLCKSFDQIENGHPKPNLLSGKSKNQAVKLHCQAVLSNPNLPSVQRQCTL